MLDGAKFYRNLSVKPSCNIQNSYILCTIHRAENTDNENRIRDIFEALNQIGEDRQIILPLHPRTAKIVEKLEIDVDNLTIIEPIGYLEMVWLINNCEIVMTDSGGLQKEAYFFSKLCITLRDETEWVELVENGFNTLVGADKLKIIDAYKNSLIPVEKRWDLNLYGRGDTSKIIIQNLIKGLA